MSRFLMDRGIFDNPLWQDPPTFRLFFYLVGKASYKDGTTVGKVTLKRGQYVRSYRKLQEGLAYFENNAEKTYSTSVLKRCVEKLVQDGRIQVEECEHGTLFTVLNYDDYQGFPGDEPSQLGTGLEHCENNVGTIRTKLTKLTKGKPPLSPKGESEGFQKFWEVYPKKTTKQEARNYWHKSKLDDKLPEILNGLNAWKNSEQWIKDDGKYIPDPIRFLKRGRWLDEVKPFTQSARPMGSNIPGNQILSAEQRKGGSGKL